MEADLLASVKSSDETAAPADYDANIMKDAEPESPSSWTRSCLKDNKYILIHWVLE